APLGDRLSHKRQSPGGETLVNVSALRRVATRTVFALTTVAAPALVPTAMLALATSPAAAMTIERVVSPGGIEAWLVRDTTLPMIALEFSIRGSADQDPAGKPGVANMATSLLDEGAGPFDAAAFNARLENKAIELSFRAGRDYLRGTLRTLAENRDEAF